MAILISSHRFSTVPLALWKSSRMEHGGSNKKTSTHDTLLAQHGQYAHLNLPYKAKAINQTN